MTPSISIRAGRAASLGARLAILCLLAASCSEEKKIAEPLPGRLFDFTLIDVNPNSSTYRQPVSVTTFQEHPVALYAGSAG